MAPAPSPAEFPDLFGTPAPAKPAPKPANLYVIPAGARSRPCTGSTCTDRIYWMAGCPVPLSINPAIRPECQHPTATAAGAGVSHFLDCPDRDAFSASGSRRGARSR